MSAYISRKEKKEMNIKKFDNFMNVIENSIDAGSNQHEKKAGITLLY